MEKLVLIYLPDVRSILLYRDMIFNPTFPILAKSLCNNTSVRNMYICLILEYWELPEIQQIQDSIISIFNQYRTFNQGLLYKAIKNDDVDLFAKIVKNYNVYTNKVVLRVLRYQSYEILSKFNDMFTIKVPGAWGEIDYHLFNYILNSDDPGKYMSETREYITKYNVRLSDIYSYLTQLINGKNIKEPGHEVSITRHQIDTQICNTLKFLLKLQNKYYDYEVHKHLLDCNVTTLCHEYLTDPKFKEFLPTLWKKCLNKMSRGYNILGTLKHYPALLLALYESNRKEVVEYHHRIYVKINGEYMKMLLNEIYYPDDVSKLQEKVYSSEYGGISKKNLKKIYQKNKRAIMAPNFNYN